MHYIDRYVGFQSLIDVVGGYILGFALLCAALGFGTLAVRRWFRSHSWHLQAVLTFGLGCTILWALTFLLGHLFLIGRVSTVLFIVVGLIALVVNAGQVVAMTRNLVSAGMRVKWPSIVLLGTGCLLLFGAARPPLADDELGYHWPSALAWAAAGGWKKVPFRLSDGPAAMEELYTLAATFHSSTAAHMLHEGTFVLLCLATASATVSLGGQGWVGAVLMCSVPTALAEAFISYSDVAACAFGMAALALLLRRKSTADSVAIGVLCAMTISVKWVVAGPLLFALGAVLIQTRRTKGISLSLKDWGCAVLPILTVGVVWLVHTDILTGHLFPSSNGFFIAKTSQQPLLTIRIPTLRDVVRAPFEPLLTPIIGTRQPYGARTGIEIYFFLVLLFSAGFRRRVRQVWPLVVGVVAFFVAGGPFLPRTRFNVPIYALLIVITGVGLGSRARKRWVMAAILFVALVGIADSSRRIVIPFFVGGK